MHKPSSPNKRLLRTVLECCGAVAFILAGTAVSNADPTVTGQVQHYVTCFGLMITDPAAHEAECGPGIPAVYDPASDLGTGAPVYLTVTSTGTYTD